MACVLSLAAGCSDSTSAVAAPARYTPPPPAPPITPIPSSTAKAVIYEGPLNLYDNYISYHGGSLSSRYALYDDSTFLLEFVSPRFGAFNYAGRYTRADSRIVFSWDGASTAGPWGAEATLRGDSLKVTYNFVMSMSDFVDGTYVRSSTTP
jgi:hypothetical protein